MIHLLIKLQLHLCILAIVTPTGSGVVSMAHIQCLYIHKGRNLLSVVVDLTCPEIGKSMIRRVNNDVTLGLTNDQWSTPM